MTDQSVTEISGSDASRLIGTCSCGHELLEHFHHHRLDPQPCLMPGCDCKDFRGYETAP